MPKNVPRRHDPLYPSEPPDDPGGADCFFLRGIQLSTQSRPRESECITVCIGKGTDPLSQFDSAAKTASVYEKKILAIGESETVC